MVNIDRLCFLSELQLSWAWLELTDWLTVCVSQPASSQYSVLSCLSPLFTRLGSREANVKSSLTYVTVWHFDTIFLGSQNFWQILLQTFPVGSGNLDWNICRYEVRGKTLDCTLKNDKVFNWQYVLIWLSFYRFIRLFIKFYNRKRSMAGLIYSYQIILNFMQIIPLQKIYHWPSFKKISSASCSL